MEEGTWEGTRTICNELIKKLRDIPSNYDVSDIGNEVGIVIGYYEKSVVQEFKTGFDHGVSLSDGTHV
ncbi:MAG: hypothetical protein GF334_07020 [Candidatus Altiarchaeales archaeon]|nr:hypothetical protein [Candidatus Altiarchaeales archaeon]